MFERRKEEKLPAPRKVGVEGAIKLPLETQLIEFALDMLTDERGWNYAMGRLKVNWDVQRQGLETEFGKDAVAEALANHKDPRVQKLTEKIAYKY